MEVFVKVRDAIVSAVAWGDTPALRRLLAELGDAVFIHPAVHLGGHGAGANQAQGGGNDDLAHGVSSLFCHGERAQP